MPRTARASVGGYCYHALNRGNKRGSGHLWQGRFNAFAIEQDEHLEGLDMKFPPPSVNLQHIRREYHAAIES